jgi:hypothetical protein
MTQQEYKKTIEAEIRSLNKKIDLKIIKGLPYSDESRKHKMLLRKLQNHNNLLSRLFSNLTFQH